ncbi:TPA: hypothetical protein U1C34_002156 [Streptococcus suis]|nr:hypothetical protein [Streptococcus suis]HEM3623330.1 hypothetical protein [Streptococcus suis]HEM3629619.1 hypothetical protein [Streptococcus suis]HEM3632030.1 hypothetical protein [Streptococcus suis]HEM3645168.1 hypothetical protein [Streptococcus suis]
MNDRTQLLDNLFTIRQGLIYIYEKEIALNNLENARRKAVLIQEELVGSFGNGSKPISERLLKGSFYAVLMGAIGNIAKFLFLGIWGEGNISELFWYLVASAGLIFLIQKKMRQHRGVWIGIGIFISLLIVLTTPLNTIGIAVKSLIGLDVIAAIVFGILSVIIVGVSLFLGNAFYPKWVYFINQLIDEENRRRIEENDMRIAEYTRQIERNKEIVQEKRQCELELSQAAQALSVFGQGWYPKDYYFLDAVDFFIASVENFKADTIKELVNLYDDTKYKATQLAYQAEMLRLQHEQYINSERMVELLRYNNYLQEVQVGQLEAIRINTEQAASYLRNLRVPEIHNHYY